MTTTGARAEPNAPVLRFLVVHEAQGFSAGCIDAMDIVVLGATRDEVASKIPSAIREHFGCDRAFRILTPKVH